MNQRVPVPPLTNPARPLSELLQLPAELRAHAPSALPVDTKVSGEEYVYVPLPSPPGIDLHLHDSGWREDFH